MTTRIRKDWLVAILLGAMTATAVVWQYQLGGARSWSEPIVFRGDSLFTGAFIKLAQDGCWSPFCSKMAAPLGAPFIANWNDFPVSEDWLYWVFGAVARHVGIWAAANLAVVVAAALASIVFFHVARRIGARRSAACLGAFLFGISPYLFERNISHFQLVQYWHIPLLLYVAFWLVRRPRETWTLRRFGPLAAIAFLTGILSVYYLYFWLLLLVLVAAWRAVQSRSFRAMVPALVVCGVAAGGFLVGNADTLLDRWQNGSNTEALRRDPRDSEIYSLRPAALLMPSRHHRWWGFRRIGRAFEAESAVKAEHPATYLGVLGVLSLGAMMAMAFVELARGQAGPSTRWAGTVLWLGGACCIGGLNSLYGLCGFYLFRGANRISIVIMALALLFGIRLLWRVLGRWHSWAQWSAAGALSIVGLWDQPGSRDDQEQILEVRRQVETDKSMGRFLQANLPRGGMVFELPAMKFPGHELNSGLWEYELFRPYFYTKGLRFSCGGGAGRPDALWQLRVGAMELGEMLPVLRAEGFQALYVDKRGYRPGQIKQMKEDMGSLGVGQMFETEIALAVLLSPAQP